jgi:hypothetical protein
MEDFRESSYCIGVSQKLCLSARTNGAEPLMQNAENKGAEAKGLDWMDDARRTPTPVHVAQSETHASLTQAMAPSALSDSC